MLEEVEDKSQIKYRKVVSPTSNFGIQMKVEAKGYSEWEPISDVILEIERDLLIDDYGGDVERHILLRASTAYRSAMIEMKTDEFRDDKKLGIAITNALGSGIWIKINVNRIFVKRVFYLALNTGVAELSRNTFMHIPVGGMRSFIPLLDILMQRDFMNSKM